MDIEDLKKLAGITDFKGYSVYEGSNISVTGMEKRKIEKEMGIRPGDPEWFALWFSLPYLTNTKFFHKIKNKPYLTGNK